MNDRPPYMLSDEELLLDDDQDTDPFADAEGDELDFNRFQDWKDGLNMDVEEPYSDEDDRDHLDETEWYLKRDSDIDNERW